jgi:MFS family permease
VFYISLTTFARYAALTFQSGTALAGLAAGIFVLGSIFGRLFSGAYMERIGRRRLLLQANSLFFLFSLSYFIPAPLQLFLCFRFLHGFSFGNAHSVLATAVVNFIPKSRWGEGIGLFSLNFTIATALGPFIGLFLVRHFSYTALFAAMALGALLSLILACFIKIEQDAPASGEAAGPSARPDGGLLERSALPLSALILIMSLCYTGVTAFLDSYAAELGLSRIAPIFFVVYAAFILIFRPRAGKLLDKKGDNIVMLPAIVCYALSLLILGLARQEALFLLAAFFMALGYGNILNIGQAIAVKSVPPARVGKATSTYFVFSDAGQGLGPLLVGLIVSRQGFSTAYFLEAGVIAASLALYYALHGHRA